MELESKAVQYDCALLTDESLKKVRQIIHKSGILRELEKSGVRIPDGLSYQENMHCTFRYMKGADEKRDFQLSNNELHQKGTLVVEGIGAYIKDGTLMNLGLFVNDEKSFNEEAFQNIRCQLFSNDISHITIAVNPEVDESGKPVAKAVDTQKCFMDDGTFGPTENYHVVSLDKPVELEATAEAIRHNQVADSLIDYPQERRERELKEADLEMAGREE